MDAIREQLNRPLVGIIAGFVLGLIIGWFVLGWWLAPVTWTDAAPADLLQDYQVEYLRMAIDSYLVQQDPTVAQQRYAALGEDADEALAQIAQNPGRQSTEAIGAFASAVEAAPPPAAEVEPGEETVPGEEEAPAAGGLLRTILPVMCVLTLLLFGGLIFILWRGRSRTAGAPTPAVQAQQAARDATWTDYNEMGEEPPMAQFMASYKLGDDLFDDSFSIDSPSGEFLGECGVGISETIGVGDPKKVTAFEVWLFDKNDIQTVTKVLMSEHAYEDETIRQRLAAKGEPVLASPGNQVVLETATLQLVARVVDMSYGEGALPEESFFDSLILELAIWPK